MKYKVHAKCFVVKDNKILILKKSTKVDKWHLPGGRLEPHESLETCCARELNEELGITVTPIFLETWPFEFAGKEAGKHALRGLFTAKMPAQEIKLSHEHTAFAWITLAELNKYAIGDKTKTNIKKFFSNYSQHL